MARGLYRSMRAKRDESIKISRQASNRMGSAYIAASGLHRNKRDGTLVTSGSHVKEESINLFWVPFIYYGDSTGETYTLYIIGLWRLRVAKAMIVPLV